MIVVSLVIFTAYQLLFTKFLDQAKVFFLHIQHFWPSLDDEVVKLLKLHISDVQDNLDEAKETNISVDSSQEAVAVDTLAVDGAANDKDCGDGFNPGGSFVLICLSSSPIPISLAIGKSQEWPDGELMLQGGV